MVERRAEAVAALENWFSNWHKQKCAFPASRPAIWCFAAAVANPAFRRQRRSSPKNYPTQGIKRPTGALSV
jgi:hypothetical protein